jgi:4-amino-4-deoxy-L-arabinose transferase-like glycosyltransferase
VLTSATLDLRHEAGHNRPDLRFWLPTALVAAVGLAIRLVAVVGRSGRTPIDDAFYYHYAANLLVGGYGFIDPFTYYGLTGHPIHTQVQTAAWPPMFVWVLAMASLVGFKSYFAHRIWCCIIGAAAIVVCGMAGREIAGRRVGILTALVVAIYPNIWMSVEPAMSETLTPLVIGLVLWAAYRFWKQPSWQRAAILSLCIALGALARDELTTLFILLLVPLCLLARDSNWRRRFAMLGVAAAVGVVVIGPWVGYNMSRFSKPVFISDGLGSTLASADCAPTFSSGQFEGFWDFACQVHAKVPKHPEDESVTATARQDDALHFLRTHLNRLVPVTLAKVARGFGFFRPYQQVRLDIFFELRPARWAFVGLWSYYALFALSIPGLVVLIRRKITVLPLAAVTVAVVLTMMVAFGDTRYRTPFEIVLAILASVAVDGLVNTVVGRRRKRAIPAEPVPAVEPAHAAAQP